MNPSLYRSAKVGNVAELGQHKDVLDGELTPNHNTVLHAAAQFGHLNYVKEVLEACPSLLHRLNVKGETPLHTAAREGRARIDDTFLDSGIGGGRNLACNAHVHLAKLEKARRREKQERKMTNEAENRRKEAENRRKEEAEDKENRDAFDHSRNLFQTLVVVAALIATITFAAAFTIPGGYDGNQGRDQGMAILAREAAFKAFVITNTIAMVCSLTSIFLCLSAVMYGFWPEEAADRSSMRYVGAWDLIVVSMFFLMIAQLLLPC
ncbi:hypothetical protein RHGRI_004179 [Rhododendron griersonianum]|uniref:PGG domain-containing protein n=1 Tax=Rhododendron griersonianum TaxID=479676 RepID=A0AAV6L8N4_9ERIC|nr:hypothetical protein RHGRI_004179 [Rhododendron griersonianum]